MLMDEGSIKRYVTAELRLIWSLLQFNKGLPSALHQSEPPIYVLGEDVKTALAQLEVALKKHNHKELATEVALRKLFDLLYFPSDKERDASYHSAIATYPVLQFIIYQFITAEGTYEPIHQLPPTIAKFQYCMRLHGLYRIDQEIKKTGQKHWRQ